MWCLNQYGIAVVGKFINDPINLYPLLIPATLGTVTVMTFWSVSGSEHETQNQAGAKQRDEATAGFLAFEGG
jgi:hypothetical protein